MLQAVDMGASTPWTRYLPLMFSIISLSQAEYSLKSKAVNATKGRDHVFMCTATVQKVQFQQHDASSYICIINGFNADQTCNLIGSYNTQYQYRCFPTNKTVMITIPGTLVDERLHGTKWECFDPTDQINTMSNVETLHVNVPISAVEITSTPTDTNPVKVVDGTKQIFLCKTNTGRPAAIIQWYLSNDRISSPDSTLQITCDSDCSDDLVDTSSTLQYTGNTGDADKTIYCIAMNTDGQDGIRSNNKTLEILFPPGTNPVIEQSPAGDIFDGTNITLKCSVSGGNPLPTLQWNCTGTNTNNTSGNMASYSITITVNKTYNRKICACSVQHPATSYRPITIQRLIVYYAPDTTPVITQTPQGPINSGSNVTFTCSVSGGNPLAVLSWNCSGNKYNNTSGNTASYSVDFTVDKTYNNRICTCSGSHNVSSYIPTVHHRVVVYYAPITNIRIQQSPLGVIVAGDLVTLTCSVSGGNPLPILSWNCTGNDHNKTSDDTASYDVNFTVDKSYNKKTCTCSASHPVTSYNHVVHKTLDVFYAPDTTPVITQTPQGPIISGNNVKFTCSVSGGNPLAVLTWNCSGNYINNTSGNTTSYSVDFVVDNTDNNIICTCSGSHSVTSYIPIVHQRLVVYYTPDASPVISQTPEGPVINGGKVTLTCSVSGGNPLTVFSWNCSGINNNNTSEDTASYSVDFIVDKMYNNRICTCSGSHSVTSYRPTVHHRLVVYYAPDVTVYTQSENFSEGDALTLICDASGNPSDYTYHGWTHVFGGTEIQSFDAKKNGGTLELSKLSYQDIGNYSCSVANNIPDQSGNLIQKSTKYIEINFSPVFINFASVTSAKAGTNATAFVELFSFPDITKPVQWQNSSGNKLTNDTDVGITFQPKSLNTTFYNTFVSIDKYTYRTALHFRNFQRELGGYYTFLVHNSIGKVNLTLRVVLSDVPDSPYGFSTKFVSSSVVILSWTAGFNGGNPQTFVISYSAQSSNNMLSVIKEETDFSDEYEQVINELMHSTTYEFTIIASNIEGNDSAVNNTLIIKTEKLPDIDSVKDSIVGPVGGALGGTFLAAVIVVVVILYLFRKQKAKEEDERKKLEPVKQEDNYDEGLKDNILYESAGPRLDSKPGTSGVEYAVVEKKDNKLSSKADRKVQETALYTEVQKKPKPGTKAEIYANVSNSKTGKGKPKTNMHKQDDVYENMEKRIGTSAWQQNEKRNKDRLQYADLVFNPTPNGAKFVIHGLEDRTIYAEVDTTQKIDPLPDSDGDESAETTK